MDPYSKPCSLSVLRFSCGKHWTRNHTCKISPKESAQFNLPPASKFEGSLWHQTTALRGHLCSPMCKRRSPGRGQWEGQCHIVPCVCWSLVAQEQEPVLQLVSDALEITADLSSAGFSRGEMSGCDFFIFEAFSMGKISDRVGSHLATICSVSFCGTPAPCCSVSWPGHSRGLIIQGSSGFYLQALATCTFN